MSTEYFETVCFFVFFRHVTPYVNNEAILQLSWFGLSLIFASYITLYHKFANQDQV